MSDKVTLDFKAKHPCRRHSKEEKKKQKREWKERRRLERKKSKECKNQARQPENHVERETCNAPQNKAVSHTLTVSARSQTGKQVEEITVEAEVWEHLNRTEAILDSSVSPTEKNLEQIAVEREVRESLKRRKANQTPPLSPAVKNVEEMRGPLKRRKPNPAPSSDALQTAKSRGERCVVLARFKNSQFSAENPFRMPVCKPYVAATTEKVKKCEVPLENRQERNISEVPLKPREVDCSLLVKIGEDAVGSDTFGECFIADYRGIKVVVKEMKKRNDSLKETGRCKKEVLHEAKVLNTLGDHEGLPLLFGVCVDMEPFCLVTQFYGLGDESLTLHKAIKSKILDKSQTAEIFLSLLRTLEYIHSKGYLHNDLKSNNVVLEQRRGCFCPIIIDFGKSKPINKPDCRKRSHQTGGADYIAPEVRNGLKETTSSDVYSLGKMLERAVYGRSFSILFSEIVVQATNSFFIDRPSVSELIIRLQNLA